MVDCKSSRFELLSRQSRNVPLRQLLRAVESAFHPRARIGDLIWRSNRDGRERLMLVVDAGAQLLRRTPAAEPGIPEGAGQLSEEEIVQRAPARPLQPIDILLTALEEVHLRERQRL